MLYILGGASRSGKSIVARRLVEEKKIPFFCIDFLISSLQEVKHLEINHGQEFIVKAEKLWPLTKPLYSHLITEEPKYLIEGDGILPKNVAEIQKMFPGKVKACFVGFSQIDPSAKLKLVKEKGGQTDDWTKNYSDEELLGFIKEMIDFSKYLKGECEKYDIKYFDSSDNFEKYLEDIYAYLAD